MSVIRSDECRRSETPAAVMTTLASPTQGGAERALWRVDMGAGAAGPAHVIDAEQIWTVLEGSATVVLDGETFAAGPGDTLVMPADVLRQITADGAAGCVAIVTARSGALATVPGAGEPVTPPWAS